jgi:mRNA interferase RelE/StbE
VSYAESIQRSAQKELQAIPSPFHENITEKMLSLGSTPRPPGCKILKGSDKWRIRIGNYRLIYEIDDDTKAVIVIKIAHRSDVYR